MKRKGHEKRFCFFVLITQNFIIDILFSILKTATFFVSDAIFVLGTTQRENYYKKSYYNCKVSYISKFNL